MRALLIACGNPLRGDDGVAAHTLALFHPDPDVRRLSVQQLTPELASELARYDLVIFVDADPGAERVRIRAVDETTPPSPALTHHTAAREVVALARALFDWRGAAFACALPVSNLDAGAPLSARARRSARTAAGALARFVAAGAAATSRSHAVEGRPRSRIAAPDAILTHAIRPTSGLRPRRAPRVPDPDPPSRPLQGPHHHEPEDGGREVRRRSGHVG